MINLVLTRSGSRHNRKWFALARHDIWAIRKRTIGVDANKVVIAIRNRFRDFPFEHQVFCWIQSGDWQTIFGIRVTSQGDVDSGRGGRRRQRSQSPKDLTSFTREPNLIFLRGKDANSRI